MKFFFTPRRVKGAMKRGVRVTGVRGMKVRVRGLRARVKKGGRNAVSKSCQGSCFTMIKKKIPTVVCIDRCTTLEHILYECQQTMEGIFVARFNWQ